MRESYKAKAFFAKTSSDDISHNNQPATSIEQPTSFNNNQESDKEDSA